MSDCCVGLVFRTDTTRWCRRQDNGFVDCCVSDLFDRFITLGLGGYNEAQKTGQWNVSLLLSWVAKYSKTFVLIYSTT